MSDTVIDQILAKTNIAGLNIPDALARMGNSAKLYMRIVHSFVVNMPKNLDDLATTTINAETLSDYAIKIHGAKGSCYGIGAQAIGDVAKSLEVAAKAGDLTTCLRDNDSFVVGVQELIKALERLEARVEAAKNGTGKGGAQAEKPDTDKLAALLTATQSFDLEQMNSIIEELSNVRYEQDSEIVSKIKESFEAFDYQAIEETIFAYLR